MHENNLTKVLKPIISDEKKYKSNINYNFQEYDYLSEVDPNTMNGIIFIYTSIGVIMRCLNFTTLSYKFNNLSNKFNFMYCFSYKWYANI